ncbi:MAG: folate family ECF transporter S component [Clostridia bacterium]|nr:folate family ECF transporter S component [Clostridia bacterium]
MKKQIPPLTVKNLCILALLTAITALLSIFCTIRFGQFIKIPLKFISVFVTASIFGPVFAGVVAATGDILNCILAPSGAIIPQITVIEFLSGAVYGLFFFKPNLSKSNYIFRTILCVLVQFGIDMFVSTALFTYWLGWFSSFWVGFSARIVAGIIKVILQATVILMARKYIDRLRELC